MSQYETQQQQLEAELLTITRELEAIATFNSKTGDWVAVPDTEEATKSADANVTADNAEEWEARRALMPQLETRYRNVKRALDKIESGTYGICEISGEPIEEERLTVNPAARTNLANVDREKELPL